MTKSATWIFAFAAAVVALCAGWLFLPVRTAGYPTAPKAGCLSNVKLNGLSLIMYSYDWDDRWPNRDVWMDVIEPYSKNREVLHDPALKDQGKLVYGYAYNRDLSEQKVAAKPEKVPLVFDSVNLARNASGTLDSLPDPARHEGSNHVCYADGSVREIPGKTAK